MLTSGSIANFIASKMREKSFAEHLKLLLDFAHDQEPINGPLSEVIRDLLFYVEECGKTDNTYEVIINSMVAVIKTASALTDLLAIVENNKGKLPFNAEHAVKLLVKDAAADSAPVDLGEVVVTAKAKKKTDTDNTKSNE